MESKKNKKQLVKKQNLVLKSQLDNPKIFQKLQKRRIVSRTEVPLSKKAPLFLHLPQYDSLPDISSAAAKYRDMIPPDFIQFCITRSSHPWKESDEDIATLFHAFERFFKDYKPIERASSGIKSNLEVKTNFIIQFISDCIGIGIGFGNAIKHLKVAISQILARDGVQKGKPQLESFASTFVQEKIRRPFHIIVDHASAFVKACDSVMIFAPSAKVVATLCDVKPRRVFCIADRNSSELGPALKTLSKSNGIDCTLANIAAVSSLMKKVDKVLLEATAVFSNGSAFAPIGSALIGMAAFERKVPLVLCCASINISERVQLDPIVFNEIDSPAEFLNRTRSKYCVDELRKWRDANKPKILNMRYDVIPAEFIAQIITEYGPVAPSSVSIIKEVYNKI